MAVAMEAILFKDPYKQACRSLKQNSPSLSQRAFHFRGAAGIRTLVQTNSPNAFYMLIPALIVGK